MTLKKKSNLTSLNIKERQSALDQLEHYRILIESVQDYAIFLLDPKGNVASWNKGAERFKGYKAKEIIGRHFSIFYPKVDKEAGKPERVLAESLKHGRIEDEGWRIRKDGTRFWANVIITALKDENGKHVGFAKVTRDLTERKLFEDELSLTNIRLREQQGELEKLNTSKDEFISLASHQLRTPATGVKQFLGLLLQGYAGALTEQQRDFVQKAYDSNDRQIDMINDLLRVAQVDAGKVVLEKSQTDIYEMVEDIIDELIDSFKARKQQVSLVSSRKSMPVIVDSMRFRMVLENLIDNASKYTPEKGTITITLSNAHNFARISIADNGVGIKKSDIAKLFTKFGRIPNSLSDSVGGSGLGLYWANKVTELHGGKIKVTSAIGKGSDFAIIIPKGNNGDKSFASRR